MLTGETQGRAGQGSAGRDHVGRPHIHGVVQRVAGPTLVVGGGVAGHIGLELQAIVKACDIYTQVLGLNLMVAMLWQERHAASRAHPDLDTCEVPCVM
ncbi:MAG: hypothetical protein FRX49_10188 [Trebouxia sp. A1-2]|nr:MAG: hypothetical protein FRX49_10188 [Trebouxia sp. A1-2]